MTEGKRTITVEVPSPCESCPEEWRRQWGCGCSRGVPWTESAAGEGYAGQGDAMPEGAKIEPYSRTCRQWFSRSPFVRSVLRMLEDYRGNRLGVVTQLPAPLATYLRVTDRAFAEAKDYWDNARLAEIGNG